MGEVTMTNGVSRAKSQEICGVIRAKINLGVVREYTKTRLGTTLGTVDSLVSNLVDSFRADGVELVTCTECHGQSPVDIGDECPFCGAKDEAEIEAKAELATVDAERRAALAKSGDVMDLDAAIKAESDFIHARGQGALAFWEMGRIAGHIQRNRLWSMFVDTNGKQTYSSFEQYAFSRFGFKATHTRRMITIAEKYSKEEAGDNSIRALFAAKEFAGEDRAKVLTAPNPEVAVRKIKEKKEARRPKVPAKKPSPEKAATFIFSVGAESLALVDAKGAEIKIPVSLKKILALKPHVILDGVSEGTKIAFGLVEKRGKLHIRYSVSKE